MCRSAIEYPPNGKRCGLGDHFSESDREARRLARNAREKELYYIRKERSLTNATSTITLPENIQETIDDVQANGVTVASETLTLPAEYMPAYEGFKQLTKDMTSNFTPEWDRGENSDTARPEELDRLKQVLLEEQAPIAYMGIKGNDEEFYADCTNDVQRLYLEDGSTAYFKSYDAMKNGDQDSDTIVWYGHTVLESFTNEVAAYELSKALGKKFEGLVPMTAYRQHEGVFGTIQAEARGVVGEGWRMTPDKWDETALRRAALFDYIAGSQDRHGDNYAIEYKNRKGHPVLIDNGFAFPTQTGAIMNYSNFIEAYIRNGSQELTEEDRETLSTAIKAARPDGPLTKYLPIEARDLMIKRCEALLEDGRLNEGNYMIHHKFDDEW